MIRCGHTYIYIIVGEYAIVGVGVRGVRQW